MPKADSIISKKKTIVVAISIILLMLMLCSALTAAIPAVKAYDNDYGYAINLYTTNWSVVPVYESIDKPFQKTRNCTLSLCGSFENERTL